MDSVQSTQSNNSSSNVIVVCIGNSFKTKCFTTSNTATSPTLNTAVQPPSSPKNFYKAPSPTTNNKLNHNVANNSESKGNKINCQMNNLLEEDEEEMEGEKIDATGDKKEIKANGAHLSAEQTQNGSSLGREPPQNLLINCVNGLKTETCI